PPTALDARLAGAIPVEGLQQHAHRWGSSVSWRMGSHPRPPRSRVGKKLESWSRAVTAWTGSSWAFEMLAALIIACLVTGPIFGFSDTWQLVINTGTSVGAFLMVFLIQRAQNKD